jgi:enoyl-CoA hydratase
MAESGDVSAVALDSPAKHVLRVTLRRPEALNAFTAQMLSELTDAFHAASADSSCRAVILTGAGRAFCAGVDLRNSGRERWTDGRDPIEGRVEWSEVVTEALMAIRRCSRPVIAAVNGIAVGGGLSMALLADIRIGSTQASFADGYIRNGASGCELGTSYLLPRLIGQGRAMELMLTGATIDAATAERYGLLNRIVAPHSLDGAALETAGQICQHSAFAVTMTKQVALANLEAASLETAMLLEMRTQMLAVHTADSLEARSALTARRDPVFTGYRTR